MMVNQAPGIQNQAIRLEDTTSNLILFYFGCPKHKNISFLLMWKNSAYGVLGSFLFRKEVHMYGHMW